MTKPTKTAQAAKKAQAKGMARTLWGAGLSLILALALSAYAVGLLRPLDDGLAQLRFRLLDRPASQSLTVIEVDVASLRAAGTWPWSRARWGQAIDNLTNAGAELVAFDVDFSAASEPAADRAMAEAIGRRPGVVVLPTFVQPVTKGGVTVIEETNPLASLAEHAILASVNVPIDSDGRARRYRYGFTAGESQRQSLAATLAGAPPSGPTSFLIDYGIDVASIDRLSFEDAYTGKFDPALVRGRKILIGATALELGDEFATPLRGTLPGVFIHALAYESLHAGRALAQLQLPILLLLTGLAALLLAPRPSLSLGKMLRRHALAGAAVVVAPVAIQAILPISVDASPILVTQALCLVWVARTELRRRELALVEEREASLLKLAMHMRRSRERLRGANRKLQASNAALDKALKARTEFLATTSHEIRTPLNAILGVTQVILADRTVGDGLRDKIALVQSSGDTMLALVEDILDVAKIETGALVITPVEMDLHKLLKDAGQLWSDKAKAKGLTLRAEQDAVPSWINEDQTRLRQIVFNLMSNAVKFTEAGEVGMRAAVESTPEGERLVLEVSDSGIGIPDDKLEEIFEAFRQVDGGVTRKYEGTGLGLAICRQLAVAMGGELSVRSTLGEGSVFTVRLPLRRVERKAAKVQGGDASGLAACAVLLVEGNPLAQSMLKASLGPQVGSIEVAASVDLALAALQTRRVDLILAEGRTLGADTAAAGEAVARLAGEAAGAKVSVLWPGSPDDVQGLIGAGAAHVAQKPIGAADLVRQLKALFAAPATMEEMSPISREA